MNIGVVLVIEGGSALPFQQVSALLAERVPLVPRLRQRLQRTPPGCGRSLWVDAADFELDHHLEQLAVAQLDAPSGAAGRPDENAPPASLLSAAVTFVCTPLPRDRPLWAARWVTGPGDGDAALVLSAHHCLADGLGGLAVLAALCDEGSDAEGAVAPPAAPARPFPSPPPRSREVAIEAWQARLKAVRRMPSRMADSAVGVRELLGARRRPQLAERTSLNRPTGPGRRLTTVATPLAGLVEVAHARGCTVNDLVLCSVAGAVGALFRARAERVSELVASVPVSGRRYASADRLGNQTGVMALPVPLLPDPDERLSRIMVLTSDRKGPMRGASSGPLGVAFRALAHLGAFQLFIDHQRLIHTFVTNVRGPAVPWHVAGHRVTSVVPLAITPGNVGVSFDILSYAGQLVVTLVADPAVVPDQDLLTAALADELAHLTVSS
jgi:WS/DGAT/MGAT family acyltransferase